MRLRLGIVGLGSDWESRYAPALRALSDRFEVRAICTPVAHRAEGAARQFNARVETGFHALASRPDIDAVLLLAADWYGSLPLLAACDYGKAVYCAVALDMDPDHAASVKQRVEAAGVAFTAELPRRLSPATLRLKELIATQLGEPRLLFCHQRRLVEGPNETAHAGRFRGLMEAIDWCRYIVGRDPTSVFGLTHSAADAPWREDYQMMSLDFSDPDAPGTAALAQISCGRYVPAAWQEVASFRPPADLQIVCAQGVGFVDLPATLIWFDSAGRHMESLQSERPVGQQLFMQFHRSVTSLVRDVASLEDAYRASWIAIQARISHEQGRRLELSF
ncbi:MAG: Gfo/Idh/MocA family oxidoreductase [Planctomycetia bacterium]|nr:MAG: Gfo/Idh/MocA family oxidoreductase [Planctomycetia bacterium]